MTRSHSQFFLVISTVLKEFDNVILDCEVTGLPLPVVTWFKGNKPIRSSHKFVTERNTLRINSIMIQDAGVYSCEAKNQAGMCKNHKKITKFIKITLNFTSEYG